MPGTIVKKWLNKLRIPVSAELLTHQLKSHPDYPSLLSITDTLDYFGITNTAVQVEKEVLPEIDTPFLAHLKYRDEGFVICDNGTSPENKYPDFFSQWSGVIVMAEIPAEWSHQLNNDLLNKEKERKQVKLLCTLAAGVIAAAAAWVGSDLLFSGLLLLAAAGIFVSWMIISRDLGIENKIADEVCGKEKECTEVLHSKGATLLPGVGLSDVSLLWFAGLFISLCTAAFTGNIVGILPLVSVLSLVSVPVIFYSLFYQWRVVRKWCRLCLITVTILILQFIILLPGLLESGLQLPDINGVLLFSGILFGVAFGWFSFKSLFKEREKLKEEVYNGIRFKQNETVVKALLEKKDHRLIIPFENDLQLGNRLAPIQITVACNPYCGPCAVKHELLHEILENNEDRMGLTIRFLVKTEEPDNKITRAVRHIFSHIALHVREMTDRPRAVYTRKILHDWFTLMDYEKFVARYPAGESAAVTNILRQQEDWCKEARIHYTPTIFINGYELPFQYSIKDIPGILPAVQGMIQPQDQPSKEMEFV